MNISEKRTFINDQGIEVFEFSPPMPGQEEEEYRFGFVIEVPDMYNTPMGPMPTTRKSLIPVQAENVEDAFSEREKILEELNQQVQNEQQKQRIIAAQESDIPKIETGL